MLAPVFQNRRLEKLIADGDREGIKRYMEGLESKPPTEPGIFFKVESFSHQG